MQGAPTEKHDKLTMIATIFHIYKLKLQYWKQLEAWSAKLEVCQTGFRKHFISSFNDNEQVIT